MRPWRRTGMVGIDMLLSLPPNRNQMTLRPQIHHPIRDRRRRMRGFAEGDAGEDVQMVGGFDHVQLPEGADGVELAVHANRRAEELASQPLHEDLLTGR